MIGDNIVSHMAKITINDNGPRLIGNMVYIRCLVATL